MTVKEIGVGDVCRLQQLAQLCYLPAFRDIHTEEQNLFTFSEMYGDGRLHELLSDPDYHFFILSEEGRDVGYLGLYPLTSAIASGKASKTEEWLLDKIYLLPEVKGKGYGRHLMTFALNFINEQEEHHRTSDIRTIAVKLHVNRRKAEVEFYKHMGFRIVEEWDIAIADGKWVMDGYTMEQVISLING